jgi:hypothetical protein
MVIILLALSLLFLPIHADADSFTLDSGHFSQNVNSGFAFFDFAGPGITGQGAGIGVVFTNVLFPFNDASSIDAPGGAFLTYTGSLSEGGTFNLNGKQVNVSVAANSYAFTVEGFGQVPQTPTSPLEVQFPALFDGTLTIENQTSPISLTTHTITGLGVATLKFLRYDCSSAPSLCGKYRFNSYDVAFGVVPEPSTLSLCGAGLLVFLLFQGIRKLRAHRSHS